MGFYGREIRAASPGFSGFVDLYFFNQIDNGLYEIATGLEIKQVDRDKATLDPVSFVTIDELAAQQLMDDLWRCGLRPSEGAGSAGALRATENHLEDMRRLVFEMVVGEQTPKRKHNLE